MRVLFAALLLFLCATPAAALAADRDNDLSPDKVLSFADRLYDERDYYRAISEYERFLFLAPGDSRARTARYQIAMCYLQGERHDEAIRMFRKIAEEQPRDGTVRQAQLGIAEALYLKRRYDQSTEAYLEYLRIYPDAPDRDNVRLRIGWSRLRQGNWRDAGAEFDKVPPDSPLSGQAQWLAAESRAYPDRPEKSPALAGGLSAVLPGAGQYYVGRERDALVSFLLNGIFGWATLEAVHNRSRTTAGVLLFFESGWYFGNVYNAVSSAYKYNRDRRQEHLDRMSNQYGLSLRHDGGGTVLAFALGF